MKYLIICCVLISSFSFLAYSISYFTHPHMKREFERFELKKLGLITIMLEILGALGLLIGLLYKPLIIVSSCGLSIMMLIALIIRIKSKDSIRVSLPAIFYMILNAFIFYYGINY